MKHKNHRLILISVLGLLVACSGGEKAELPSQDKSKAAVKMLAAGDTSTKANVNEYRLLGQVSSQEKILLAFKVTGMIERVLVRPGMRVKKGQVIASLDNIPFKLKVDSTKLQFDKATNEREKAERDFKVEKDLRDKDISSLTQFQNAELVYKNAVLAQSIAEVAYNSARVEEDASRLTAPADGTISQQLKYIGDKSDGTAFEMFALTEPEIYLNAPESLLNKLSIGTNLDVTFPSIETKRKAQIVRVVPAVRESDRSFLVVVKLKERDPLIVPGIFAEALVTTPRK